MPGIFPEEIAGGVVYRDATGSATNPPNVATPIRLRRRSFRRAN